MRALIVVILALATSSAVAQQASVEDRLREALRRTTVDLRALQDGQAALQANLDAAVKQRDLLQQQLDAANAKLAATPAAPPPPPPGQAEEVAKLHADLASAQAQNAELQAGLAKWQAAYQQAAGVARAKEAERATADAGLKAARAALSGARDENAKLVAIANDILHLYRTQDFRSLLLGSYEPLLGLKKVQLENLVQDYEDKIYDQTVFPPPGPPARAAQ